MKKFKFNNKNKTDKAISEIAELASANNFEIYLVGGFVRDRLMERDCTDIDITVIGNAVKFAEITAGYFKTDLNAVYKKFGTALLVLDSGIKIEFASAREESYQKDSRKPTVEFSDLEHDLSRRDFTVNALAVSLNKATYGEITDRFNGIDDLKKRIIRTPLEPEKTFDDDPLRILRAIRFAAQLEFNVSHETLEAIKRMLERLHLRNNVSSVVSQERITEEFLKILSARKPSIGLSLLQESGVMNIIFPEISDLQGIDQRKDYHHKDVFYHTLQVVDNISMASENIWLRFAALMHDIAKPPTKKFVEGTGWTFHGHEELGARWQKKIFSRMKLPFDRLPYLEKLVRLHLRPIALADEEVTDSAIRRLIFEAGDDINDLMTLCRADITSKDPAKIRKYLSNFDRVEKRMAEVEERDRIRNFQSPVRGEEIMKICNIPPSKKVGLIKHKIEEAILDGIIPNEHDAALEFLYKIKDEIVENSQERG